MANVWVYKFDGSIQCEDKILSTTIEDMKDKLAELIGASNIVSMKKDSRPMIQLCGMPTGKINTFEITEEGWRTLSTGTAGPCGFERLDKFPASILNTVKAKDSINEA